MPSLSDESLLADLAAVFDAVDPVPDGLDAACGSLFLADLRALTVRQPWASAIVGSPGGTGGPKDVENRTVRSHRRGLVLIHAGLVYDRGADQRSMPLKRWLHWLSEKGRLDVLAFGAIVGAVVITGCHTCDGSCSAWAEPGAWHVQLGWRRAFETPVPALGALGPWRVEGDVRDAALRQLAEVAR